MKTKLTLSALIALVICAGSSMNTFGQEFTVIQQDIIKEKVDSLISAYAWYGDLTENDRDISQRFIDNFKDLFTSDATVLNDIETDLNRNPTIPLNTYVDGAIQKFPSGMGMSVDDIEIKKMELLTAYDMGQVQVDAVKKIIGFTVYDDIFDKEFQVTFFIKFDLDFTDFKILGIRELVVENKEITFKVVDFNKGNPLPDLRINLFYDNELKQQRTTNVDGMVTFTEIPPGSRIMVYVDDNQDYIVETGEEVVIEDWLARDEGGRKLYLQRLRLWTGFSIDGHGTAGLTNIKAVSTTNEYLAGTYTNDQMLGYSFGIGVSYFPLAKKTFALGIGIGADMDILNAGIKVSNFHQSPYASKDTEGRDRDLLVNSTSMEDELSATYISAPVTIRARWIFDKKGLDYIYLNVGAKYSYLLFNNSMLNGYITYQGYYDQYYLIVHDVEALNYVTDMKVSSIENEMKVASGNISVIASAGVSIPLINPVLNLDIGIDFNMGMNNISDYSEEKYYLSKQYKSYESLAGSSASLKTQLLGFRIGITYDIFK